MRLKSPSHESTITSKQNRFCGPAAISAITGISCEQASREIAAHRDRVGYGCRTFKSADDSQAVRGAYTEEVLAVLKSHGFEGEQVFGPKNWKYDDRQVWSPAWGEYRDSLRIATPTFKQWWTGRDSATKRSLCLIVIGRHFVVVRGDNVSDNQQGLRKLAKSKHNRKRIKEVVVISERVA